MMDNRAHNGLLSGYRVIGLNIRQSSSLHVKNHPRRVHISGYSFDNNFWPFEIKSKVNRSNVT